MKPSTIAIDGPAASGKSTIGYHLSRYLAYLYLDTGVLYRAVTWAALDRAIAIADEPAITTLAENLHIDVTPPSNSDGRQYTVRVEGRDVTWDIRSPEVDAAVSPVSAYPGVRVALTRRMREIAALGRVVMVGRDIGTVVIPDADMKLYVIASAEKRAHRRQLERQTKGECAEYEAVLANLQQRDKIDSSRAAAPLKAAPDAIIFDNTDLTIEEMLERAERLVDGLDPI
ncbi:MAG TPA: (d)CMP kinase [Anaerolineae bacterium]|nr:(d)CMP kinase [Anaerolineae bacterium]HQI85756.1 (d)CMP kinase [Anaerolineae bacterium]